MKLDTMNWSMRCKGWPQGTEIQFISNCDIWMLIFELQGFKLLYFEFSIFKNFYVGNMVWSCRY